MSCHRRGMWWWVSEGAPEVGVKGPPQLNQTKRAPEVVFTSSQARARPQGGITHRAIRNASPVVPSYDENSSVDLCAAARPNLPQQYQWRARRCRSTCEASDSALSGRCS